jgi:hypothetical protein
MDRVSELRLILGGFLHWNKSRLDCFARMILALLVVQTANLRQLATAFIGESEIDSHYKRIKRFFAQFIIDHQVIARWIFQLFFSGEKKVYITIDRTNWFRGKTKINILMVGIAYEGLAIPIFWRLLNKAGNATAQEHIEALQRFVGTFGKKQIAGVLGDREFASGKLFRWLNKRKIPFYIRIKDNSQLRIRDKKFCKADKLFNNLNSGYSKIFSMAVDLFDQKIYLAGARSERGELMIVATNQNPTHAIAIYLRRWEIESLFQGLKSRGFELEETHLRESERLEKLITLLAVSFCWAHKIGEWRASKKPIVFNRYKTSRRPQYSYFRYGMDFICQALANITCKGKQQLKKCIQQLWLPDYLLVKVCL